jgi:tRNA modification GTPase
MDELISALLNKAEALLPRQGELALNRRHREALIETLAALEEASSLSDPLLCAELFRQARAALDRITGRAGVENMLDALFGRFCVGK